MALFGNKYKRFKDEELVDLIQDGVPDKALSELYRRYAHLVFGVGLKYLQNKQDAEDMSMEVFASLPTKIRQQKITYFKSWLYQVVKNQCLMQLRKKKMLTSEVTDNVYLDDCLLEEKLAQEASLMALESALTVLKPLQRDCITLFYLEQKSYQEISEDMQLPLNKVKSAIQNGKRNLYLTLMKNEKAEDHR